MGFIVNESDAKELILQLDESLGHSHNRLDVADNRHRPLRSFSSAIITGMTNHQYQSHHESNKYSTSKIMRAAILFLFQDINFKLFKELSAEATILSGLEKGFLRYDEIGVSESYLCEIYVNGYLLHNIIDPKML
jgi:hypothetical protein